MLPQTVKVGAGRTSVDVVLSEDMIGLEDVVVTGYTTMKRKDITGSVSSISADRIERIPAYNITTALTGIAGIRMEGGSIRIRGTRSRNDSNDPLIVLDGIPYDETLSSINPGDIESIDVLKDGSAAAIYGTRGTNGVILVTTKKAHAGENRIEFSAYVAMQSVDKKPDVMAASEYRNTIRQYFPDKASSYDFGGSTDWFDAVTRKHPVSQNYNVSSSGGSAKLNYRASVSYTNDIGLVKKTGNEKLRGRLNVSQSLIRDRLKVDYNFAYTTGKGSYADKFIMRQAGIVQPDRTHLRNQRQQPPVRQILLLAGNRLPQPRGDARTT